MKIPTKKINISTRLSNIWTNEETIFSIELPDEMLVHEKHEGEERKKLVNRLNCSILAIPRDTTTNIF